VTPGTMKGKKYWGTARKVKDLGRPKWHPGSAVYKVDKPVEVNDCGFLTETEFVIVAVTPEASDHGEPETAIFAAQKFGKGFGVWKGYPLDDTTTDLLWDKKVVGKQDHQAALDRLQGGYRIVE
jgi:hypothetical protein